MRPPRGRGRRLLTWISGGFAGLMILAMIGAVYEAASEAADQRLYPPPGEMVDVGGYRLHINCQGSGSPTVVIAAGLGDWSASWADVQAEVAQTTQVCAYDRAGTGWSDPGPFPRDAGQFVKELHTLLQNANLSGPFVLVGHSLGGLPVRVFADQYPAEVAGVVLIDSMYPGQGRSSPRDPNSISSNQARAISLLPLAARLGIIRLLAKPIGLLPYLTPADKAYYAIFVSPKFMQAMTDETQGVAASLSQAEAVKSFGGLPLIVLSRGQDQNPDWTAGQAGLLHLSTDSHQLVAEKSGHTIQLDQPEAAVGAIVKMVEIIRSR